MIRCLRGLLFIRTQNPRHVLVTAEVVPARVSETCLNVRQWSGMSYAVFAPTPARFDEKCDDANSLLLFGGQKENVR